MPRFRARRWFQFGFGTLLIAVTVCGVWFGRIAYLARQQREAIRLIESLGGTVVFDHKYEGSSEPPWPEWLRELLGEEYFRRVQGVALVSEDLTDDGLSTLASLGNLRVLRFHSSKVTDEGIAKLLACKGLESLEIRWAQITDAAMVDIGSLTHLKELRLLNTKITDDGVSRLSALPQLATLIVGNFAPHGAQSDEMHRYTASITDAGLRSLADIDSLTTVDLMMCQETAAGVAEFRKTRPR